MKRFVEGTDRGQSTLFPAVLDDYVGEDNPVRAIDIFVDGLDLAGLGFDGVAPFATGRQAYHPAPLLKIYIYGYFNRVQSSRRLEREHEAVLETVQDRLDRNPEKMRVRRQTVEHPFGGALRISK
jgi:transposase